MASNKKKETADMENKISNPNVKELEQTRTTQRRMTKEQKENEEQ